MGATWLGSLPRVLEAAGLDVVRWPGWEHRSRSTGGYERVLGIGVHHDAIRAGVSLGTRCHNAWDATWNANRPIGALWVHTDGRWVVGAAGATNTQGRGGPYEFSKGVVPLDQGNLYMLSIEASNDGVGEIWPDVQQESYVAGCAALCDWLDLVPAQDVIAHFEWAPGRKVDPAGPSRYAAGAYPWDMGLFRSDVHTDMTGDDDMEYLDNPVRMFDSRDWGKKLQGGEEVTFDVPVNVPGDRALAVTITAVQPDANGYVTKWSGAGARPTASTLNYTAGVNIANSTVVKVHERQFKLFVRSTTHLVIDIDGYQR